MGLQVAAVGQRHRAAARRGNRRVTEVLLPMTAFTFAAVMLEQTTSCEPPMTVLPLVLMALAPPVVVTAPRACRFSEAAGNGGGGGAHHGDPAR